MSRPLDRIRQIQKFPHACPYSPCFYFESSNTAGPLVRVDRIHRSRCFAKVFLTNFHVHILTLCSRENELRGVLMPSKRRLTLDGQDNLQRPKKRRTISDKARLERRLQKTWNQRLQRSDERVKLAKALARNIDEEAAFAI